MTELIDGYNYLKELQKTNPTRERAIALTHLETAILFLNKDHAFKALGIE